MKGNPLYKIVEENGEIFNHKKKTLFCDQFVQFTDEHGRQLDPIICHHFYDLYWKWNHQAKEIWRQNLRTTYDNYSEYMYAQLAAHTAYDSKELKKVKYALMKRLLIAETVESGSQTMDDVSLNEYGSYDIPIGPDYEFPGGFGTLVQFLADKLPDDAIKTSHPVRYITFADRQDSDSDSPPPMLVECFNGVKYKTQHIVCTVSSAYLKAHYMTLFNPSLLSEQKILAINTISMDTVDKIFLFYEDMSFFPAHVDSLHPIFMDTDAEYGPRLQNNWPTKISSVNRFFDDCLLIWVTGQAAHYMEQLSPKEIADEMTKMLKRLLNNVDVPEPSKVMTTNWHSNPYTLGSYSFIHKNSKSARNDVENLAAPIYIDDTPRVMFAGEATHLRYYSTVTAAYLSGQREAKRLIAHYGNDKVISKTRSRI